MNYNRQVEQLGCRMALAKENTKAQGNRELNLTSLYLFGIAPFPIQNFRHVFTMLVDVSSIHNFSKVIIFN
jgi:hypothetical protein